MLGWGHERGRQTERVEGRDKEEERQEIKLCLGAFKGCTCHTAGVERHLVTGDDVTALAARQAAAAAAAA